LVFCVNRATKNAYADGYDVGYLAGYNDGKHQPARKLVEPRTPIKSASTITSREIDAFLNREGIKVNV
jgi:hypothetical protein